MFIPVYSLDCTLELVVTIEWRLWWQMWKHLHMVTQEAYRIDELELSSLTRTIVSWGENGYGCGGKGEKGENPCTYETISWKIKRTCPEDPDLDHISTLCPSSISPKASELPCARELWEPSPSTHNSQCEQSVVWTENMEAWISLLRDGPQASQK